MTQNKRAAIVETMRGLKATGVDALTATMIASDHHHVSINDVIAAWRDRDRSGETPESGDWPFVVLFWLFGLAGICVGVWSALA